MFGKPAGLNLDVRWAGTLILASSLAGIILSGKAAAAFAA
jgi:hypothetical protein